MKTKLKKPSKYFMVNMEQTINILLLHIMNYYDYDIEQAQELICTVVEAQAEEIIDEAEANDRQNTIKKLKQQLGE